MPQLPRYSDWIRKAQEEWLTMVLEAAKGSFTRAQQLTGDHRSNIIRLAKRLGLEWVDDESD